MSEEHLSEEEKKLFEQLERQKTPPAHLSGEIVSQLKKEGLIENVRTMNNYFKWVAGIAAAILIFCSGTFYQSVDTNEMEAIMIEPTKGYMLLLHEDKDFAPGDQMEMFEEYKAWMENTFAKGIKITGQELKDEATLVKGEELKTINSDVRTTGYFLVEANSLDDAIKVAQENPHIKYGGSIEVKPYMVR